MRLALTLLWLTLAMCGGIDRAVAHAALLAAHPADGALLEQAPATVRLHFNEPVRPLVISLIDAAGRTHRGLPAAALNEVIEVTVPADLPPGSHVLSYRVASGDGHPVGGSMVFSIGTSAGSLTRIDHTQGISVHRWLWLARVAFFTGLFAGAGGTFFQAWLTPRAAGRALEPVLIGLIGCGIAAVIAALGLQGVDALGEPIASLGTVEAWAAGWRTSFGPAAAIGATALVLAGMGLTGPTRRRRACSLAGLVGVGLSLACTGHASAASPQWLTRPAVFLHAIGVAYWIGALIPLLFAVREARAQALPVLRRFSTGAMVAVPAVVLAGALLAAIQVQSLEHLIDTPYGRVLIVKALLVVVMLGLAALNRARLTPALASSGSSSKAWLVRTIATEMGLAAAIFCLVGLWRFTPPPRTMDAAAEAPASVGVHLHSPRIMAQVTLAPGSAGERRVRILLSSARAEPVDPKEVTLILANPQAGIEAISRAAQKVGPREWRVQGLILPQAGEWVITVDILVDDFEKASLEGSITLSP